MNIQPTQRGATTVRPVVVPGWGVFLALFGQARKVTFQALSSSRYEQYLRVLGLPFPCFNSSKYLTEP